MEGRRRQKGDNYRRPVQSRKPPRVSWQPTVPLWEKDFCKVVGSLDWETLLQMKKFTHLYSDVMNWNDSAGKEAFHNAKKRYWAEINGISCNIPLPDPNLYIDEINWDSETETEPDMSADFECKQVIPNTEDGHDPVVIFGDSLLPNQAFSPMGWGDDDEKNFEAPVNQCSGNYEYGDSITMNQAIPSTGWGDCEQNNLEVPPINNSFNNYERNWGNSLNTWPVYSEDTWQFSGPSGYMSWGTNWHDDWGWTYGNNHLDFVGPEIQNKGGNGPGLWNDGNHTTADTGRHVPSYNSQSIQVKDHYRNHTMARSDATRSGTWGQSKAPNWGEQPVMNKNSAPRKWNPIGSCGPVRRGAVITVGRAWNQ